MTDSQIITFNKILRCAAKGCDKMNLDTVYRELKAQYVYSLTTPPAWPNFSDALREAGHEIKEYYCYFNWNKETNDMKNSYNALDNLKIEASKLIDAIRSAPVKQLDSAHRIRMNATKIQMQVTRQTLEVLRKENPQAPGDVETYTKEIHLIWTNYEIQRRADKDHNYHMSRESAGWILDKLRENHQPDGIGDVSIDYWIKQRIEKNEQAKQLTETEQIVYDLTKLVADRSIDMPTESVVKGFAMSINAEVDVKRIIAELEKESN